VSLLPPSELSSLCTLASFSRVMIRFLSSFEGKSELYLIMYLSSTICVFLRRNSPFGNTHRLRLTSRWVSEFS
jgi:hypothetical protein